MPEFCSVKLANWLREKELQFCLRLKKNEFILGEDEIWHSLDSLDLEPGVSLFLQNIKVRKSQKIQAFNLAAKWKRSLKGWSTEEGWFILTNLADLTSAINAYKKPFDIVRPWRSRRVEMSRYFNRTYATVTTRANGEGYETVTVGAVLPEGYEVVGYLN